MKLFYVRKREGMRGAYSTDILDVGSTGTCLLCGIQSSYAEDYKRLSDLAGGRDVVVRFADGVEFEKIKKEHRV